MSCPSRWVLFAFLFFSASSTFADSLLNGLAVHKELNKDMFIGALYTDTLSSDAEALLNSTGRKRIELKVTTKRLSSRGLNSMWIEGMAINNPPALLTAQANNMVAFTALVNRSLKAGDILAIRGVGNTTTVTLNDTNLGSIESPDFFSMVLRTWIGNVPLSSDFRAGLLTAGNVNGDLLAQFESIEPSASRKQAVANWSNPQAASDNTVAAATSEASPKNAELAASMSAPAIAAATVIGKPSIAAASPQVVSAPAAVTAPEAEPTPAPAVPAPAAPAPAAAAAPVIAAAPAQPDAAKTTQVAAQKEEFIDEDDFEDEDSGPALTAESLLSRQLYHSQLLRWTYQYIRYPKRAISRGHEGSVRIAVVIDRNGKVKNVSEVEASEHDILNREALKAVERAAPFPQVPEAIAGNEFAFSLPIQFKLPD